MSSKIFYRRTIAIFLVCTLAGLLLKILHVSRFLATAFMGIAMLCLLAMLVLFIYQSFFDKRIR